MYAHNVRAKLRFRRTWADFSRTLSDYRQLFAPLIITFFSFLFVSQLKVGDTLFENFKSVLTFVADESHGSLDKPVDKEQ